MLRHERWPDIERSKLSDVLGDGDDINSCELRQVFAWRKCIDVR